VPDIKAAEDWTSARVRHLPRVERLPGIAVHETAPIASAVGDVEPPQEVPMSRRVFLVVAVASLCTTASLRAQGPTPSARSESVRATEMARRDALLASDTVALSKLVAGEFIEISRLGTIRSRADNMREVASGDLKLLTIKYDSLDVRVYGDVALLTGIADNTGMYRGTVPFSGKIRYTRVFVWRDGRWQAVSMQQTPMS